MFLTRPFQHSFFHQCCRNACTPPRTVKTYKSSGCAQYHMDGGAALDGGRTQDSNDLSLSKMSHRAMQSEKVRDPHRWLDADCCIGWIVHAIEEAPSPDQVNAIAGHHLRAVQMLKRQTS